MYWRAFPSGNVRTRLVRKQQQNQKIFFIDKIVILEVFFPPDLKLK